MPEQLDANTEQWARAASRLATDVLLPLAGVSDARAQVQAAAKDSGLYQLTQPASHGGSEGSQLALCAARDALLAHNPPHSQWVFGPGPGVLAAVKEPLRSRYLAPLLAGDKRAGFGFTEADDAPFFTRAVATADGYRVDGQKSYVTGGGNADFLNTLVHIDGQPALLIIDTAAAGVERSRRFRSIDGSEHAAFAFTNVPVPAANLLAAPGAGMPKALGQIGDTRLTIAANCVGLARWVYGYLADYLTQPARNGQPRGADPVARLRLGECYVQAFAARSMLYRTARLADAGENSVNEAMACKVFAVDCLTQLIDSAIQVVGGEAVIDEHPLARLYLQVRSLRLAEGATDRLFQNMARGRLELAKGRI